ncbi:50S ribosomal protein L9 [Alphaproteobacteria bacterium]|jgi:large subunit ribosomal protein L9|nr:50S ribosomal protein L9 [Alphaproteobacteria bacterium]
MQVVLLERIAKLGQMGEVVTVKDGYARNFLLPSGKALRANKANLEQFNEQRAQLETQNLERRAEAEKVKETMNGQSLILIRQSGETGQLYGSVSTRDIANALKEAGFSTDRNQIILENPIKTLGIYNVRVTLHPEVDCEVSVNVARTRDEAERQAQGEDVTAAEAAEDALIAAEAMLEREADLKELNEEIDADDA